MADFELGSINGYDDEDDFLLLDDVDLADETTLKKLVTALEEVCQLPKRAIRVNVLMAEQWQVAQERSLSPKVRKAVGMYVNILPDPGRGGHWLVGPSAITGLNEKVSSIYTEIVYKLLHAAGDKEMPQWLMRGSSDLLAQQVSHKLNISFYTRSCPAEALFVAKLLLVLQEEFGRDKETWLGLLKNDSDKFLLAVRKSKFTRFWIAALEQNDQTATWLEGDTISAKREHLTEMLKDPVKSSFDGEFMKFTTKALDGYLRHLKQNKELAVAGKKGKKSD